MRRVVAAVLLVAAALLTGGCFRLDVAVEVRNDGSGTVREVFAVDRRKAEATLGASEGLDLAIPRADSISNLPGWARVSSYRQGGLEGVAVDLDFPTADQLGPRLAVLHQAITGTVGSPATTDISLRREGRGWRFEAQISELSLEPDAAVLGSGVRDDLYDTAEIRLTVRLPGRVLSHNADRLAGSELTWTVPRESDDIALYAVSAPFEAPAGPGRPSRTVGLAIVGASVGGATLGLVLLWRRRPSPGPAASSTAAGSVPTTVARTMITSATQPDLPAKWPSTPPTSPPTAPPGSRPRQG